MYANLHKYVTDWVKSSIITLHDFFVTSHSCLRNTKQPNDHEFQMNLSYILRPCLKKIKNQSQKRTNEKCEPKK